MAYDEGLAKLLRGDLADEPGISEKRMFGGLAFLLNGNMLAGVHGSASSNTGVMFRVGKAAEAKALSIEGAQPMDMNGRRMGGWIDVGAADDLADDARRKKWLGLALAYARALPAK